MIEFRTHLHKGLASFSGQTLNDMMPPHQISCLLDYFARLGFNSFQSLARMYEFRVDQNKLNWSIDICIYIYL